jgi:putative methionine-R-sulfoxide reductase with GAF domain
MDQEHNLLPNKAEAMRILFVTQSDPFYVGIFFREFRNEDVAPRVSHIPFRGRYQ